MPDLHRNLTLQGLDHLIKPGDIVTDKLPDGTFHVEITTSSELVAQTLQILRVLMLVSERIYKSIDRAETTSKSEDTVKALRDKEKAVAQQYWIYRDQGIAHRKAIEITCENSEVAQRMAWSKTDVGYCVRSYPKEYFLLNVETKEVVAR